MVNTTKDTNEYIHHIQLNKIQYIHHSAIRGLMRFGFWVGQIDWMNATIRNKVKHFNTVFAGGITITNTLFNEIFWLNNNMTEYYKVHIFIWSLCTVSLSHSLSSFFWNSIICFKSIPNRTDVKMSNEISYLHSIA